MADGIVFCVPWPPTVNTYWRNVTVGGKPRTLISRKGRIYRQTVAKVLLKREIASELLSCRLRVHIKAYPPDKRRRDLDNLPKAVLDAFTHAGVWADDSQIDDLRITRYEPVSDGRLNVRIVTL